MKITLCFKQPDVIDQALEDNLPTFQYDDNGNEVELFGEALEEVEDKREAAKEFLRKWLLYSELLTVEFDTETNTATVVKPR